MKKQIVSIALGLVTMMATTATFAAEKNASADKKVSANEKGFIVNSQVDGHAVATAYDKKGNWVYTIERYSTDNLAKNVMDAVKENFGNYFIRSIEKVEQRGEQTVFVVHAEDSISMKTLKIVNGEVELVQDFVKG